ncbi:MAG: hypothetical protein WB543_00485 [Candidatus Acidiferrum sp.]
MRQSLICGVAAFLLFGITGRAAPANHDTITVCELVRNAKVLDGRIVRIRTVVDHSKEGQVEDIVSACPTSGDSKAKTTRVRIFYPDEAFMAKAPKGFHWDAASFQHFGELLQRASAQGKPVGQAIVTVEGVAYAPPSSFSAPPELGKLTPRPVEGTWDASIVIGGIYDVKIPVK